MSTTSISPPPIFPSSILSSSLSACRRFLLDRRAGIKRLRRAVGGDGLRPPPPQILCRDHGEFVVLARPGQAVLRQRLRHLVSEVADRKVHGVRVAGGPETRVP